MKRPRPFETLHQFAVARLRLLELEAIGETGWLKALKLDEYVRRKLRRPVAMQQPLSAYAEAL